MLAIDVQRLNEINRAFNMCPWEFVGVIQSTDDFWQCWIYMKLQDAVICCTHGKEWDAVYVSGPGQTSGQWSDRVTGWLRDAKK